MERSLLILVALAACGGGSPGASAEAPAAAPTATDAPAATNAPAVTTPAPAGAGLATGGVLEGVCEASAILPWEGGWLVADNEDDTALHAYGRDFTPRATVPLPSPVDDVEALVADGGGWIAVGSHSTNKEGEPRPARERIVGSNGSTRTVVADACPRCVAARGRAPEAGGFNIEGAARWAGKLWIGLRAPLGDGGGALLLSLDDDARVVDTVEVDLGGSGVRDLFVTDAGLLVVAGPVADGDAAHTLWRLDNPEKPPVRLDVTLPPSTEGIAVDPAAPGSLVYVTDGDGKPGKRCKTPATWGRVPLPG